MKKENNRNRFLQTIGISLLSFILALSTILPSALLPVVSAADGSSEIEVGMEISDNSGAVSDLTEEVVTNNTNSNSLTFRFTLNNGNKWASDLDKKKDLVISAFGALANVDKLNLSRLNTDSTNTNDIVASGNELTVKVPVNPSYKYSEEETYSINFSPALIENWPGKVKTIELKIHSKPRLSIGGSVINSTTIEDIQKGGKTIELKLVNATWKPEEIAKISNYNKLLASFTANSSNWHVAEALKKVDPNEVISYSNENRTLHLKLPAIQGTPTYNGTVTFNMDDSTFGAGATPPNSWLYDISTVANIGDLIQNSPVNFTINTDKAPRLSVTSVLNEADIKSNDSSKRTLSLKLDNTQWTNNFSTEKKKLLIDSIQAKDQKDQWDIIKSKVISNIDSNVSDPDLDNLVTITIPEILATPETSKLLLAKDQILSVKIPYQLLEKDVKLPEQKITIKAQPKVLLSGTAKPSMSQIDLAKGGKTIALTLVNAIWDSEIASSTAMREDLLNKFTWININNSIDQSTSINSVILAKADVKRTNERTVTIKLPAISDKFSGSAVFQPEYINMTKEDDIGDFLTNTYPPDELSFKIGGVQNQSVTISGTATNKINELDIIQGSKTVVITLKNDTWKKEEDLTGITLKAGSETLGYSLKRTNDTTVTLTLDPKSGFSIKNEMNVDITVPNTMLSVRNSGDSLKGTFKISPLVSLSGTGINMDTADAIKGKKTIIITLNNAEFKKLNSISGLLTRNTDSKIDLPTEWTNLTEFKISKNKLTVTLPALPPTYGTSDSGKFNVNIPSTWLTGYTVSTGIVASEQVSMGANATAKVGNFQITEAAIKQGNNKISIELVDATWDPTIETNASKKSALMKGFTVSDQTKEWGLVTTAIAKNGTFKINGKTLNITLPSVPDYSIVRDQKVSVTIPKTVLNGYKYDIPTNQVLSITVPDLANETSFTELLDSGLADFIEQHKIENIRVAVPKKNVDKFTTYVSDLGTHKIATVNVYTSNAAAKVTATLISNEGEVTRTIERNVNNLFTLVFDDMKDDSTLHITVRNSSDEVIQEIFQKVANGNKTYTVAPKTPLDGKYSLYSLLTEKSLLTNILKYYSLEELKIGTTNN